MAIFLIFHFRTASPQTEFKVTFDPDNGEEKTVVTVKEGNTVARPEKDPVKEGAGFFLMWVKEDGTAYNFEDKITSDLTLLATYKTTFVVTFVNGGTTKTADVKYGEKVSAPEDVVVSKEEGGFASWRDKDGVIYNFDTPVTEDITLTASMWENVSETDDVYFEAYASYSLSEGFFEIFREKSDRNLPTEVTSKTKKDIETYLEDILVFAVGNADVKNEFTGYWVYGDYAYYNHPVNKSGIHYLYCEVSSAGDDEGEKVVVFDPETNSVTIENLEISALFSEGELKDRSVVKKTDNPAFEDIEVSVLINGVDSTGDDEYYYKFDYTLDEDKKCPISLELTNEKEEYTFTYSNKSGDYIIPVGSY